MTPLELLIVALAEAQDAISQECRGAVPGDPFDQWPAEVQARALAAVQLRDDAVTALTRIGQELRAVSGREAT